MPSEKINMHGKIYQLLDNVERNKQQAQDKATEVRKSGMVAFLNPAKRKDKETVYFIYEAEKSVRSRSRKSISSKLLLEEYKKGSESFDKFMKELEKAQEAQETKKNLAINESAKETPKKAPVKAKNGKKAPTKAKNGKKAPVKASSKKSPSKKKPTSKNGKK